MESLEIRVSALATTQRTQSGAHSASSGDGLFSSERAFQRRHRSIARVGGQFQPIAEGVGRGAADAIPPALEKAQQRVQMLAVAEGDERAGETDTSER